MSFFKNRICQICSKEFVPTSTTQRYCKKCGKAVHLKQVKKATKKWREKKMK